MDGFQPLPTLHRAPFYMRSFSIRWLSRLYCVVLNNWNKKDSLKPQIRYSWWDMPRSDDDVYEKSSHFVCIFANSTNFEQKLTK